MSKMFRDNPTIGRVKHSVSFHDGVTTHKDGSPFFDLRIFTTKREKDAFIARLILADYTEA